MKRNKNIIALFTFLLCSLGIVAQKTSENFEPLKSILSKNAETDKDKDGVLTDKEYQDYVVSGFHKKLVVPIKGYYHYNKDIPYVKDGEKSQALDLIIPENRVAKKLPVIVYIHGGGWKKGDKFLGMKVLDPFISSGEYIGVSINYRLSTEAKWPSQIHDCKAAIRWVKANAKKNGFDKDKICVWGNSAVVTKVNPNAFYINVLSFLFLSVTKC